MKQALIFLGLLLFLCNGFAIETGQYKYYTYGQDFNLNEFVIDINGVRDTDFSADCNILIRKDSTGILLADNNAMSNDSVISGLYYLFVDASDTNTWTRGKYSSIMYCVDYNLYGSENVSFILDKDIITTIEDINVTGGGLNADQNQILYDLNKWIISPAIDSTAPVISITFPTNNSTVSATLIEFTVTDNSDLNDIQVYTNGVASGIFNQTTDCSKISTVTTCSFYETGLNINVYNDLNITAIDDYNNVGVAYANFLYSSTRPRTSFGGKTQDLSESFSIDPTSITLEYAKGERISKTIRIKNNSNYDLFMSFAPSTELAGTIFVNDINKLLLVGEEKEFEITFINEGTSINGSLVVSSQYSSINVPIELAEKPFNWWPLLFFVGACFGGYVVFVRGG